MSDDVPLLFPKDLIARRRRRSSQSSDISLGACCGLFIVLLGVCIAIYFWANFFYSTISFSLPSCSVVEFYAATLNKSIVSTTTSDEIFFKVRFKDTNGYKGVQYSPVNLTLYYGSDTSFPVGNYTVPSFYQESTLNGHERGLPILKSDVISTRGVPWKAARDLVTNGSTVSFRFGIHAIVRFKYMEIFLNRKHKLSVWATVKVDDSGNKVGKSVDFKSSSPASRRHNIWVQLTIVAFIMFNLMFIF